jgi:signal transduction histidine kinase
MSPGTKRARPFTTGEDCYVEAGESRAMELAALHESAQAMTSTLHLPAVLETIADRAVKLIGAERCVVFELDALDDCLHLRATEGLSSSETLGAVRLGQGAALSAALGRAPFFMPDVEIQPLPMSDGRWPDAGAAMGEVVRRLGCRAALGVPLVSREAVLGAVCVYWDQPHVYDEREVRLLTGLAQYAAIAIENARLHEESQRRLGETAALLKIAEILNSQLDPDSVLKEIARRTAQVLGFERCSVFLWSDGRLQPAMSQFADGRAVPELWAAFKSIARYRAEEIPALAEAIRRAAPVLVSDADVSPLVPAWWVETFSLKTVLVVPLIRQGAVVGALHLDKTDPASVGDHQLALAMTIAAQVALAVDTARHYAEERKRAAELAALLEITRESTSTLELKPLLKQIAQRTARALDMERCSINLWRGGHLVPIMSQYADGHHDPALWQKFKGMAAQHVEDVPAHAQAIRTKQPVPVEDALNSDLLERYWVDAFGIRAALVVPLIAKDEVIGTMTVDDARGPRYWTTAHADLAMTIAAQVALSVENARLYDESQRARADLQGKNAELDTFVYSVSHDLKAPLVTIQGMAGLLLKEYGPQLPEEAARYLGRIQANTEKMERLIADLLALSRIGREARAPAAVSLGEVVDDVAAGFASAMRERGVRMILGDLPAVWGIRTQIEQVMGNLLGNAVKYLGDTAEASVEVGTIDRGALVECYVRDNGIGIDPAYHERIFEVFQRLQEVEVDGTGVGLAIVRKIVQASGGRIWLESAKGQGATFRFTWPKGPANEPHSRS